MDSRRKTTKTNRASTPTSSPKPIRVVNQKQPTFVQRSSFNLKARSFRLELGKATRIMGIVNVTPDSFSLDGQYQTTFDPKKAVQYALRLVRQGADILDIGGESTRPGAGKISAREELRRVIPVVEELVTKVNVPISVDTYKPMVAKESLKAGASLINNIMGTTPDEKILGIIRDFDAAVILMHIKGTPRTMQKEPRYTDLIGEILDSLKKSAEKCLEKGIKSDRIVIDPGIGFGKTIHHNLMILNRLSAFSALNCPLLIGTSRKSFIGKILNKNVHQRLAGTMASVTAAILNGAHIVRVHDVAALKDAVSIADAIVNETEY